MSFSDLQLAQRKERRRISSMTSSGGCLGSAQSSSGKPRSSSMDLSPAGAGQVSPGPPPTTRRLDKNLLMRSKMAAPPSSSVSKMGSLKSIGSFSRMCRLNSSNASMNRMSSYSSFQSSAASTASYMSSGNSSSSSLFRGNSVMQVAQRSNGSAVKQVIQELQQIIYDYQDGSISHEEGDDAPVTQLAMLAQWASVDAYYKVVIAKYEGIPVIINAMQTYYDNAEIQSYGCTALQHLNNKMLIQSQGGVAAMIKAMKNHATNITVQSEALQAVQRQGPKLLGQDPQMLRDDLLPALEHAKDMFLTKQGKDACMFLLQFATAVANTSPTTVRNCVSGVDLGIATSS